MRRFSFSSIAGCVWCLSAIMSAVCVLFDMYYCHECHCYCVSFKVHVCARAPHCMCLTRMRYCPHLPPESIHTVASSQLFPSHLNSTNINDSILTTTTQHHLILPLHHHNHTQSVRLQYHGTSATSKPVVARPRQSGLHEFTHMTRDTHAKQVHPDLSQSPVQICLSHTLQSIYICCLMTPAPCTTHAWQSTDTEALQHPCLFLQSATVRCIFLACLACLDPFPLPTRMHAVLTLALVARRLLTIAIATAASACLASHAQGTRLA